MKIRVVLMTENDKHDDRVTDDYVKGVWDSFCAMFAASGDKISVEKVEIVEK